MKHLFFFRYFLAFIFLLDGSFAVISPSSPIQVQGRQLLVDGKPFIIKAVCYNPTPKGESNNWNKHSSLTYKLEPTEQDLEIIEKDFKLMQEAGVNTIRVYKPITNKEILKKLDRHNIKVIVPVFTNYKGRSHHFYVHRMKEIIQQLKNEQSTLFWEIGNEWNYNFFYAKEKNSSPSKDSIDISPIPSADPVSKEDHPVSKEDQIAKCIKHLNFAIDTIREIDTAHPVGTCLGDIPFKIRPDNSLDVDDLNIEDFWKKLPNDKIDIYGVNIYDGKTFNATWDQKKGEDGWERVPSRFERWRKITQPVNQGGHGGIGAKPLYISEFGATAYNLKKYNVPLYTNYEELKPLILAIDDYRLQGILPETSFSIQQLASPYQLSKIEIPAWKTGKGAQAEASGTLAIKIHKDPGVDEEAQAEGIDSLANEIHNDLSAKDPNNLLLGGAVFEFCDEWWKAPDLSTNNPTDPSVHSIRGFANADGNNMICGGPWPDGYFHEEWFGLLTIDRVPRAAYNKLKKIYTEDDDNGVPVPILKSHRVSVSRCK